ncbi:ring-cleaving dioxygenase [Shouchella clausii]|uniref:ring-cleaving dioxygenase n=1 Tax=Shouchella clausii TaxID=79880 RepID=UPI002148814C|nr:ring-cleaving dioxygenase [Shouchella clausii]MCR1288605.1 ring-cleaving dioxygenase [Shouchella clausii]
MDMLPLIGHHHVSAITADAKNNVDFYTNVLGMRLVKKTVNQDDPSMYHLFYADERGNPGTELTFFEIPMAGRTYRGTNSISRTGLRVPSYEALSYWSERFSRLGVSHEGIQTEGERSSLLFEDFEGQRLLLVADERTDNDGKPWVHSPVPEQYGIYGLGPMEITVSDRTITANVLTNIFGFRLDREVSNSTSLYVTGRGGAGAEIYLKEDTESHKERPGRGSVHHVAFRVRSEEELGKWENWLSANRVAHSGIVERYYFQSIYTRDRNGILFELATDGPGFEADEPYESLGQRLALPPYLEAKRGEIEAKLRPLFVKREE